jgi:hypothetical protein
MVADIISVPDQSFQQTRRTDLPCNRNPAIDLSRTITGLQPPRLRTPAIIRPGIAPTYVLRWAPDLGLVMDAAQGYGEASGSSNGLY